MAGNPVLTQTPKLAIIQVASGDGTALKNVYVGGTSGSKITSLQICSTDSVSRMVLVMFNNGGGTSPLAQINVVAHAGTDGVTPVTQLLGNTTIWSGLPVDNDGQGYIFLANTSHAITIQPQTTLTAATNWFVYAVGADF